MIYRRRISQVYLKRGWVRVRGGGVGGGGGPLVQLLGTASPRVKFMFRLRVTFKRTKLVGAVN